MLPVLQKIPYKYEEHTIDFGGINRTSKKGDGELREMLNLFLDENQVLSSRNPRGTFKDIAGITAFWTYHNSTGSHEFWIKEKKFYFDGVEKGTVTKDIPRATLMNDNILFAPDMSVYDIVEDKFTSVSDVPFSYSGAIETCYNYIQTQDDHNFTGELKTGDRVRLIGCGTNDGVYKIKQLGYGGVRVEFDTTLPNESSVIHNKATVTTNITTSKKLDFVIEHNNRIWGTSGNTIYGSRQGSLFDFDTFEGLNTDSYAVDVGTEGEFTGIAQYNGKLIFFKQECIHILYGDKPKNFSLTTHQLKGVKRGSDLSIVKHNDYIYYQSYGDLVAYNGYTVNKMDSKLGDFKFKEVVSGTDGYLLYFCFKLMDNTYENYSYNPKSGEWFKQDKLKVNLFANFNDEILLVNEEKVYRSGGTSSEVVPFRAEFGPFNEYTPKLKGPSKLNLACELGEGAAMQVKIKHDNEPYQVIATLNPSEKYHRIPIQPKRCHEFSILLEGTGKVSIHSLTRTFRVGSDK